VRRAFLDRDLVGILRSVSSERARRGPRRAGGSAASLTGGTAGGVLAHGDGHRREHGEPMVDDPTGSVRPFLRRECQELCVWA
jgi:hypothetical protein